jgi:hypothetical protein
VKPKVETNLRWRLARASRENRHLKVEHQDPTTTRALKQPSDLRDRRWIHRDIDAEAIEGPTGCTEVTLHVDDEQGRVRRIHKLLELRENVLTVDLNHQRCSSSVYPAWG